MADRGEPYTSFPQGEGDNTQRIAMPRRGDVDADNNLTAVPQTLPPAPGRRLPPITDDPAYRNRMMVSNSERGQDTIISVPNDGASGEPRHTEATRAGPGIISVPGDGVHLPTEKPMSHTKAATGMKPIEIVIYFMDKTGLNLTVEDGQHATAGELFEMVMDELKLGHEAREAFSLWLVSDMLEVQLKPDHVPFKLVCYWEELLEKYTDAEEVDRERDEPVLMFQGNVFFHRTDEKRVANAKLVYLLYHEAREAVVDGRYPLDPDEYDYLAGLQALISNRGYNSNLHTPGFFKSVKQDYYPEHLRRSKWSSFLDFKSPSLEQRLANSHRARDQEFRSQRAAELDDEGWRIGLCRVYLDFCRKLPFYGAAFFKGQIEHPGSSRFRLRTINDDPVYVAINTEGVSVIDMDDVKFLLFLRYEELSWEYAEPQDKDNPDCMPCLFLQFPAEENGDDVTKLLQIFSREASLMDAMIDACVKVKKQELRQRASGDSVDAPQEQGVLQAKGDLWKNFDKMCLATFDKSGRCRSFPARTPKPNQ